MKEKTSKTSIAQKLKSSISYVLKHKVISAIVGAVILIAVCWLAFTVISNKQAKVDTEYLNALVTKSSELTTAKLNYTGMSEYTDTGISFINRSDFIMVYKATVRAGIDVKKVEISSNDNEKIVYVKIPKAIIQDVKIDASSIKYFDEKFALFNVDEKEDGNKAIELAEEAAKKEAANMGILKLADEQSATLIKGIIAESIPDEYEIKINQ